MLNLAPLRLVLRHARDIEERASFLSVPPANPAKVLSTGEKVPFAYAYSVTIDGSPRPSSEVTVCTTGIATFIREHVQIHPATVLQGETLRTGEKYTIAEIPERRDVYTVGQELQFGSVNAVKALNEGKDAPVCRVGRSEPCAK